jgi:hypothetical protein
VNDHNYVNKIDVNIDHITSQKELYVSILKQLGKFSHEMIEHIIDAFAEEAV